MLSVYNVDVVVLISSQTEDLTQRQFEYRRIKFIFFKSNDRSSQFLNKVSSII